VRQFSTCDDPSEIGEVMAWPSVEHDVHASRHSVVIERDPKPAPVNVNERPEDFVGDDVRSATVDAELASKEAGTFALQLGVLGGPVPTIEVGHLCLPQCVRFERPFA